MNQPRRMPYPVAATQWLLAQPRRRVLDLGSGSGAFAQMLVEAGHEVFCLDRDPARVSALAVRFGTPLHSVGQAESLPFIPRQFDVVSASQNFHQFAPGLACAEIARVLRPGGELAIAYNTRDETVPWVKRLAALMQSADPTAMTGDYGADSLTAVADSPYFTALERRNFRNWLPISRAGLITMVERRPSTAKLEPEVRQTLLDQVGELYDNSARAPEPLLLPFQASCWRARVDHTRLIADDGGDDGLEIPVGLRHL